MCGFVGITSTEKRKYAPVIAKMLSCLEHRGPDEHNTTIFERCSLGHARLSIIDISCGQQPMVSPVSNATIIFNGEIYGYQDIKKSLSDYVFHTNSDTEVILALYDKYGVNMTPHLPGAFSFAIWDEKKQRLFCSRDRFGEKPFFYALGENKELIFASEIKSILTSGLVKPELATDSMAHMLQFFYVHPSKTIYKNIFVLPPAHNLIFENGKIRIERYWNLPQINEKMSYSDAVEGFKHYFEQSIKKTLVADVPVGIFLSGGLDSSTIVAEAVKHSPHISTISFGYEGSDLNELAYARAVADLYQTDHHELTDTRDDLGDLFIKMAQIQDEPFNDMSQIPLYLISQHARKYFKVVLDGSGADELLGGYPSHWAIINDQNRPLSFKRKIKQMVLNNAYPIFKLFGISYPRLEKFHNYSRLQKSAGHALINHHKGTPTDVIQSLANFPVSDIFDEKLTYDPTGTVDDVLRCDLTRYMPGDILVKGDRITMANSLECRMPFLEKDLAEFLISMPIQHKVNGEMGKIPMREVYEKQWPEVLRNRPKQGFGVPYELWHQRPDFQALKQEYILNKNNKLYDYLDYDEVVNISKTADVIVWNLLHLSIWLRSHSLYTSS